MSTFFTSHNFTAFTFLILFLKIQAFDPVSSFSFTDFGKDPSFESVVGLYGNAKVVNGGSEVLLSGYENSENGKVVYKKSVKLVDVDGEPKTLVSFSTYFSFSMSLGDENGLAFVMVPSGFQGEFLDNSSSGFSFGFKEKESKVVAVEFIASRDARNESFSASCSVAINVGNSIPVKKTNVSSVDMVMRNGGKLHAWIDYQASSRCLEVRLSQYGHSKPANPLLWQPIDFTKLWKTEEMFAGFSSMKGKTSQACFLYSWSFNVRHYQRWMHSKPLRDMVFTTKDAYDHPPAVKPKSDCLLRILAAMIFGVGCGSLAAFTALYLWTMFGNRRPVVPEECVMQPVEFEYKKVNIVVDKPLKDAKE